MLYVQPLANSSLAKQVALSVTNVIGTLLSEHTVLNAVMTELVASEGKGH